MDGTVENYENSSSSESNDDACSGVWPPPRLGQRPERLPPGERLGKGGEPGFYKRTPGKISSMYVRNVCVHVCPYLSI